jgi:hypothetical protein
LKTKTELIEHLLTVLDETNELIEEDFMLVNQSANKLIVELESIIFYSKQTSARKLTEPNFALLQKELGLLINNFNHANIKKKFKLELRRWGKEIINTIEK